MFKAEHIILIGGSAGSIKALTTILTKVPKNFGHPIVIVLHRKANNKSQLEKVLAQHCKLEVKEAEHCETMKNGIIYLAPANYHLLVSSNGKLELDYSEKEMFSRPSINVSIDFFARAFKNKLTLVILSGANNDGAAGSLKVKKLGGKLIVQDPDNCSSKAMPNAVITANKDIDYILTEHDIVKGINKICN